MVAGLRAATAWGRAYRTLSRDRKSPSRYPDTASGPGRVMTSTLSDLRLLATPDSTVRQRLERRAPIRLFDLLDLPRPVRERQGRDRRSRPRRPPRRHRTSARHRSRHTCEGERGEPLRRRRDRRHGDLVRHNRRPQEAIHIPRRRPERPRVHGRAVSSRGNHCARPRGVSRYRPCVPDGVVCACPRYLGCGRGLRLLRRARPGPDAGRAGTTRPDRDLRRAVHVREMLAAAPTALRGGWTRQPTQGRLRGRARPPPNQGEVGVGKGH